MDEFSGITTLEGKSAKDYVHQDVFAKGREKKTNKFKTHIDWTMDSFYVADDNGNIILDVQTAAEQLPATAAPVSVP